MKMRAIAITLTCAVLAVVSGCATTVTPPNTATQAASDRLLAFRTCSASACGTVVVTRDSGFLGGGCYLAVSAGRQPDPGQSADFERQLAARLGPGEAAALRLPPGEWVLRAGHDPLSRGLCRMGESSSELETVVRADQTKRFRLRLIPDQGVAIERSE